MSGSLGVALDVVLAVLAGFGARRVCASRGAVATVIGAFAACVGGWLLTQTSEAPLLAMLSVVIGAALGIVVAGLPRLRRRADPEARARAWRVASTTVVVLTIVAVLAIGFWIGSNSPTETWLGPIVSHGPRNRPDVALTFDDGPNVHDTLAIAHLLDAYGAKGTFFTVGKALAARPDISRALLADGQLLGNHSYHHDQWRWLDPRYPELERTQQVFAHDLRVCPAFYRPPHGEHTPFMSYALHRKGMTMIGWDVSAADWATTNAALVARRVLDHVRAGSIIVLHDGLDGDLTADRSVLLRALPLILRGLERKGLHVERLDRMLGIPAYGASHC